MSADGSELSNTSVPQDVIEQAVAVCRMMADGKSLKDACAEEGMPARSTFYKWMSDYKEVSDMYTRAREERADLMADEILNIADAPLDLAEDDNEDDGAAKTLFRRAMEQRKQMIDARKWAAAKLNPKTYSDRTTHDHTGKLTFSHEKAIAELE